MTASTNGVLLWGTDIWESPHKILKPFTKSVAPSRACTVDYSLGPSDALGGPSSSKLIREPPHRGIENTGVGGQRLYAAVGIVVPWRTPLPSSTTLPGHSPNHEAGGGGAMAEGLEGREKHKRGSRRPSCIPLMTFSFDFIFYEVYFLVFLSGRTC